MLRKKLHVRLHAVVVGQSGSKVTLEFVDDNKRPRRKTYSARDFLAALIDLSTPKKNRWPHGFRRLGMTEQKAERDFTIYLLKMDDGSTCDLGEPEHLLAGSHDLLIAVHEKSPRPGALCAAIKCGEDMELVCD